MGGPSFALVHSPLVGPSCWSRVAESLRSGGAPSSAIDYGGVRAPDWYGGAGDRIAAATEFLGADQALVVHSGAGALVPSILWAAAAQPSALVFVDALLPHPGRSWMQTAPPALAARLRALAPEGVLPPWNRWFAEDPLVKLIDDPGARAGFEEDLPRLDLAYFDTVAPVLSEMIGVPTGFLRLSAAYDEEASEARRRGWRVRETLLNHLAMVSEPDTVAMMLAEIAAALTQP